MAHVHKLSCLDGRCPDIKNQSAVALVSKTPRSPKRSSVTDSEKSNGASAIQAVKRRLSDPDLSMDSYLIRHQFASQMSDVQIRGLIAEFEGDASVERRKSYKSPSEEREGRHHTWKLNTAISGLQSELEHRERNETKRQVEADAEMAIKTGEETCRCGKKHPKGANFYVSVKDAGRTGLLRGPFKTHAEAIAAVPQTKKDAEKRDRFAHFYSFGTVAMPKTYKKPGTLDI